MLHPSRCISVRGRSLGANLSCGLAILMQQDSPLANAVGLCGAAQFIYLKYGVRFARDYDQESMFLRCGFEIIVIYVCSILVELSWL
ncbi:hypothetical protein V6N11_028140 [Hibiscus sabdariffa]|uniref:Uncharacterized protein n=1 Tax=Hibiscus sabdariffa TaxID=183260 RepID=A0ABR2P0I9_9ROSI